MNKKSLNIFTVLILMGIMTTLMNFLNSVLASGVGLYYSGLIVHIVGLILSFILFIVLENKEHKPWASTFKKNPLLFSGGVIGAASVLLVSYCISNIGMFAATVTMIAGQFFISFLIDSKGWFGFDKVKITLSKKIAVVSICFGIILIIM
ncbi:DMT family transporter [Lutispora saccharofermentans]|uniref:DMT family transporter n=1 Tax=Lutispora saccharofermentans TaxID=3024236 RepID=A0ABT1NIB4_9FIRM|nr:DMT family transporter [Lutispora saccharofermentans]MCQ1530046.1 DMT family transporter [Lutispora saccharofermentans]